MAHAEVQGVIVDLIARALSLVRSEHERDHLTSFGGQDGWTFMRAEHEPVLLDLRLATGVARVEHLHLRSVKGAERALRDLLFLHDAELVAAVLPANSPDDLV